MRFGLSLTRFRPEELAGDRVQTLVLHLELGVTGGTATIPTVAVFPFHMTTAGIPSYTTVASIPSRTTTAGIPSRTTRPAISTRSTSLSAEWVDSP